MAQTLDEFLKEAKEDLVEFEKWWRKKNSENPEQFPMEMTTGNEGLWWEFLQGNIDDRLARRGSLFEERLWWEFLQGNIDDA